MCDGDNTFVYFLIYTGEGRNTIEVTDIQGNMLYERDEFREVNDKDFYDKDEAIEYARDLAKRHGLKYGGFDSRYGNNDYVY